MTSTRDARLTQTYKQLMALTDDKATLKRAQVAWIRQNRDRCDTVECLQTEYQARVGPLEGAVQALSR